MNPCLLRNYNSDVAVQVCNTASFHIVSRNHCSKCNSSPCLLLLHQEAFHNIYSNTAKKCKDSNADLAKVAKRMVDVSMKEVEQKQEVWVPSCLLSDLHRSLRTSSRNELKAVSIGHPDGGEHWCGCRSKPCVATVFDLEFGFMCDELLKEYQGNALYNANCRAALYISAVNLMHATFRDGQMISLPLCIVKDIQMWFPDPEGCPESRVMVGWHTDKWTIHLECDDDKQFSLQNEGRNYLDFCKAEEASGSLLGYLVSTQAEKAAVAQEINEWDAHRESELYHVLWSHPPPKKKSKATKIHHPVPSDWARAIEKDFPGDFDDNCPYCMVCGCIVESIESLQILQNAWMMKAEGSTNEHTRRTCVKAFQQNLATFHGVPTGTVPKCVINLLHEEFPPSGTVTHLVCEND